MNHTYALSIPPRPHQSLAYLAAALMCFAWPTHAHAIVTSDEAGSHIVVAGQPAFGVDLDGVVMVGGMLTSDEPLSGCSGALISDRHVLTAAHCFDRNYDGQLTSPMAPFLDDAIVFQLAEGWAAIPYDFRFVQVPGNWPTEYADIAIVTLSQDAPAGVPRYPLYGGTSEVGRTAVLAGYGYAGHGATGQDFNFDAVPTKRAGLNRVDAVRDDYPGVDFLAFDFDTGLQANNALDLIGFPSDLGFGADEVGIAQGDSGGPALIDGVIAGVTAFGDHFPAADVNEFVDFSWGEFGFDTRVSTFRSFILAATDGTAVFVPEPSSMSFALLGTMIVTFRSRPCRSAALEMTAQAPRVAIW